VLQAFERVNARRRRMALQSEAWSGIGLASVRRTGTLRANAAAVGSRKPAELANQLMADATDERGAEVWMMNAHAHRSGRNNGRLVSVGFRWRR
jgi:O-methyltransferase involved in polyketide biosynthesis